MARGCTVVNQRLAATRLEKARKVRYARFKLQRRCHTVQRLQSVGLRVLLMVMQVDEARRHDKAANINDAASNQPTNGDPRDPPSANPHISNCVEPRLGVNDT